MGVLTDIFSGGASKGSGGSGSMFGVMKSAYEKRKKKRDRAKMDTSIATEDERPSKRSSSKRSDSYDY